MNSRVLGAAALVVFGFVVAWVFRPNRETPTVTLSSFAVTASAESTPQAVPATPPLSPPAVAPAVSQRIDEHRIIGSAWSSAEQPEFVAFREWTTRYTAAAPADRAALVEEGRALATARRAVLAQLIKIDPRRALAVAVPMVVRQDLPDEIVSLLEERVSGVGDLALNAAVPVPGGTLRETEYRSALIGEREYRAHVYGRREAQATVTSTSMVGIAIEKHAAIADAPLRIVEPGERVIAEASPIPLPPHAASDPITPLAVEFDGLVYDVCCAKHVSILAGALLANEGDYSEADNQPGTSTVVGRPGQAWTHGTKKVLIIRVDFSDRPSLVIPDGGPVLTEELAVDLFNRNDGIAAFYAENSFGKTTLQIAPAVEGDSPDVTQVFRMPQTAESYALSGDNDLLHQHARTLAKNAGFDLDAYDRIGVVFPYIGDETTTGRNGFEDSLINYGGLANVGGPNFWVNGFYDFRIVAHELGHTYGLRHANLWKPSGNNPVSLDGDNPATPNVDERSIEYGDPFDLMGSGNSFENHFSHWNKSLLHWIPDNAVTVAQTSGIYRVYRFDAADANLANARALKIVRDSERDYWIGYRRATENASMDHGAYVLWGYNHANAKPHLLDLTSPNTSALDAGLLLGATLNDIVAGITIKTLAQGGSGAEEYLDIEIGLLPRIEWTSATYLVSEQGGSVVLTARRAGDADGSVSVNFATADGTATSPADFAAQSGTLTWTSGDTSDKTVVIPIVADALAEGVETFTVTLSNVTGGILGDRSVATVTIADPGVRDSSYLVDLINSAVARVLPLPDGGAVVSGWFSSAQDDSFDNYTRNGVAKVDANGNIDPDFGNGSGTGGFNTFMRALVQQPDGKFIVLGNFTTYDGVAAPGIARLNTDGLRDFSFDLGSGPNGEILAVLAQPDGKIILGGSFTTFNGVAREYLVRLNADGSVDTSWVGPDFGQSGGWRVEALALQADGKLLVGGVFFLPGSGALRAGLCRLLPDGALDPTFNGVVEGAHIDGTSNLLAPVKRIVPLANGAIVIAGDFTAFNNTPRAGIARLSNNGAIDPTFAPQPNDVINAILPLPDGRLLLGGRFSTVNGTVVNRLALLTSTGEVDATFAAAGGYSAVANSSVNDLALLPDGRVMLVGDFLSFQGSVINRPVWRFFSGFVGTPGDIQFSASNYTGFEGGSVQLTVMRSGSGVGALSVGYATVADTATAADFTPSSGVLTWADGDTAPKTITIPLASDEVDEGFEMFVVNLGQPLIGGAILGANHRASVSVSEPSTTGYAAFRAENFTAGEQANDAISGPTADPDGDGLNNLLEYALGLDPKAANASASLPTTTTDASNWIFTYTRPADRGDITYSVEASTNLSVWNLGVTHSFVSSDGTIETWRATYPLSSASTVFFRLRVEMP